MSVSDPGDLAAQKTAAEIAKLRAEAASLGRSTWLMPSSWVPLLIGATGLITAFVQYNVSSFNAEKAAFKAERELTETSRKLGEAQGQIDQLLARQKQLNDEMEIRQAELQGIRRAIEAAQGELASAGAAAAPAAAQQLAGISEGIGAIAQRIEQSDAPVYVQFRGELPRDTVNDLRTKLAELGFRSPGAERVAGTYTSEVRYFGAAHERRANDVAAAVTAFIADRGCPLPQPLRAKLVRMRAPEGSVEVWISHKCP